jgi:hypothetical protein
LEETDTRFWPADDLSVNPHAELLAQQLQRLVRDAAVIDAFVVHFLFAVTDLVPYRLSLHGPLNILQSFAFTYSIEIAVFPWAAP